MRKCVPWMLKMRESAERHGNEGSLTWPCVVNNEAQKGKWLSCDLWALGFSIPACVEEGVSVVNWVYCVSRWLELLMKVALDFVWKEAIQGPFPVYVGLVSARAGDSLSGDPFRL